MINHHDLWKRRQIPSVLSWTSRERKLLGVACTTQVCRDQFHRQILWLWSLAQRVFGLLRRQCWNSLFFWKFSLMNTFSWEQYHSYYASAVPPSSTASWLGLFRLRFVSSLRVTLWSCFHVRYHLCKYKIRLVLLLSDLGEADFLHHQQHWLYQCSQTECMMGLYLGWLS